MTQSWRLHRAAGGVGMELFRGLLSAGHPPELRSFTCVHLQRGIAEEQDIADSSIVGARNELKNSPFEGGRGMSKERMGKAA